MIREGGEVSHHILTWLDAMVVISCEFSRRTQTRLS